MKKFFLFAAVLITFCACYLISFVYYRDAELGWLKTVDWKKLPKDSKTKEAWYSLAENWLENFQIFDWCRPKIIFKH